MSLIPANRAARAILALAVIGVFGLIASFWTPHASTACNLGVEEPAEHPNPAQQGPTLGSLQSPSHTIHINLDAPTPTFTAIDTASGRIIAERFTADQSASVLADLAEFDINLADMLASPNADTPVPLDDF